VNVAYTLPPDVDSRPVLVIGAGTLGARIALMFAAGGSPVRIFNRTPDKAVAAARFCAEQVQDVRRQLGLDAVPAGRVEAVRELEAAAAGPWLIVESIAEDVELKRRVLGEIDGLADHDAVIATNSSSYPSSEMIDEVAHPERVLNMHFLMPPQANVVELMSCGRTDAEIIPALMARLPRYGLIPVHVQAESVGFIFNRIWAAIKRETLMLLHEGVASPQEVDRVWQATFGSPAGPCRLMDQVGLDVVLAIEEHYAQLRQGLPESPRTLLREYVERGDLGVKSGRGLYDDYGGA
jgi:3-hydroxybutyryl-CoA dehydrogenase